MDISRFQQQLASRPDQKGRALPPVEQWDPPFCGNIDIHIDYSGNWFYNQSPIGRPALVQLFASVIKKENDDYFLVTPVEKVGITVDDVPFIIVDWQQQDDHLMVTTQTGDVVTIGEQHPVELRYSEQQQAALPYVKVRRNLWARLHQNVYYQLIEHATQSKSDNHTTRFTMQSGHYTAVLGELTE